MKFSDHTKWRERLQEFKENRHGWTPQIRGQRFNKLLADILSRDGINTFYDQRNIGEIDVCFRIDGFRFILEAKWLRGPVNIDPVAKLALRVAQRAENCYGILVSMSGFTQPVLDEIQRAGSPKILLVDESMVDLLVSGVYSAGEVFNAIIDVASYEGKYAISPNDLHKYIKRGYLVDNEAGAHNEIIEGWLQEVPEYDFVVHGSGLPFGQVGVDFEKFLHLSLIDGVYKLDGGELVNVFEFENPQNRPIALEQKIFFVRNGAVMSWENGKYQVEHTALPGHVRIFRDNGGVSVFSNGLGPPMNQNEESPCIIRRVDKEQPVRTNYEYPISCGTDAAIYEEHTAIIGSSGLYIFRQGEQVARVEVTNGSSVSIREGMVYFLENGHILKTCTLAGDNERTIADLPFQGSVGDLAVVNDGHYFFQGFYSHDGSSYSAVIELKSAQQENPADS